MARYLLDTNVLLRLSDPGDPGHPIASRATAVLLGRGDEPVITAQVLVESRAVATRPLGSNAFGWSTTRVLPVIEGLLNQFPLLDGTDKILPEWIRLVSASAVRGKQVHDARLAAVMLTHNVQGVLTFNTSDFERFAEIRAVHPSTI